MELTIAHSPDSDDAYMMAPLALGWLDTQGLSFRFIRKDIEVLNQEALKGVHDVTAISFGVYPELNGRYELLRAGSSIQEGTGPVLVGRRALGSWLHEVEVGIPGAHTSAWLTLRQWDPRIRPRFLPFDAILPALEAGALEAGLLIHESQLLYQAKGLELIVDLGQWWASEHQLPLPMGGNAIRTALPEDVKQTFADLMHQSVRIARERHEESLDYAFDCGRGMDRSLVDRYVRAWVNDFTVTPGPRGERAVERLIGTIPVWRGPDMV